MYGNVHFKAGTARINAWEITLVSTGKFFPPHGFTDLFLRSLDISRTEGRFVMIYNLSVSPLISGFLGMEHWIKYSKNRKKKQEGQNQCIIPHCLERDITLGKGDTIH